MKYSIIIPCAKKDKKFLKRCLLSLLDQDYHEWDAVVVMDGFKSELPVQDDRIKKICFKESKGASFARNSGAKSSDGNILFFFDADCQMMPGMLTLIHDKFKKETCDFVYGAYRFNVESLNVYPSRPFDPYLLESMNYICTMSPMKREMFEAVGGFNDDLEYFQDWDFFLRAVKKGFIGYYVPDPMFSTEAPNEKSISGSGKYSFREKVLKIERLNKIPSRRLCVTSLAAGYQGIERAKMLNARYLGVHPGTNLFQTPAMYDMGIDAVLLMGFFPEAIDQHMAVFPKNCKKMIYWIGTDVWQLHNRFNWNNIKHIKEKYLSQIDKQFCNSVELQQELAEIGIQAEVLYQPLTEEIPVVKLPNRKRVSCYFSENHPLHNKWFLQDIAKSMPDVEFLFYGSGFKSVTEGNIKYVGWKPIQDIVRSCRVHLRLSAHDGFPHTPIYHLLGGRRVVSTFPLPFAEQVEVAPNEQNWEMLKPMIIEKLRNCLNKNEPLDTEILRKYYYDLCDSEKYVNRITKEVNNAYSESDIRNADLAESSILGSID